MYVYAYAYAHVHSHTPGRDVLGWEHRSGELGATPRIT